MKTLTLEEHTEYVRTGIRSQPRERKQYQIRGEFGKLIASFSGKGSKTAAKAKLAQLQKEAEQPA